MGTAVATSTRFHVGLHVSDLTRAVGFYKILLGTDPAKHFEDYAKFEVERPPLVLALYPNPQNPGGALNHIGLRFPDSESLVAIQRRLEEAGIATQRQEGVECCYALQTKFWVTDPDKTLWEIYTLHEDIDHSGFENHAAVQPWMKPVSAVWEHRLTEPVPERLAHADNSLDEVRLEGTFNALIEPARLQALLREVRRVLKPGGRVNAHGLVGDREFPGKPQLPGLASMVQKVPVETEPLSALENAGFASLFFEKLGDIHCFRVGDVELREMRLQGVKVPDVEEGWSCPVLYKGPFEEVVDEEGTSFRRGLRVMVTRRQAERLRLSPFAEQFAFLPDQESGKTS